MNPNEELDELRELKHSWDELDPGVRSYLAPEYLEEVWRLLDQLLCREDGFAYEELLRQARRLLA